MKQMACQQIYKNKKKTGKNGEGMLMHNIYHFKKWVVSFDKQCKQSHITWHAGLYKHFPFWKAVNRILKTGLLS